MRIEHGEPGEFDKPGDIFVRGYPSPCDAALHLNTFSFKVKLIPYQHVAPSEHQLDGCNISHLITSAAIAEGKCLQENPSFNVGHRGLKEFLRENEEEVEWLLREMAKNLGNVPVRAF